jgi:hypothetical protein
MSQWVHFHTSRVWRWGSIRVDPMDDGWERRLWWGDDAWQQREPYIGGHRCHHSPINRVLGLVLTIRFDSLLVSRVIDQRWCWLFVGEVWWWDVAEVHLNAWICKREWGRIPVFIRPMQSFGSQESWGSHGGSRFSRFVILSGVDTQENFSYFRKIQGSNP